MNLYLKKYTTWILTSLVSLSLLFGGLSSLALHNVSAAVLTVPSIFSSNAVLQRNMAVPIFGTGAVGATVTVNFQGQNVSSTVAADGKWRVNLASMNASTSPSNLVITSGSESITLTGVQVGEVWVCSGQSNMVKDLNAVYEGPETAADAPNHNIRLFREDSGGTPTGVVWTVSDATTAGAFSAVCYFFAHKLAHTLQPSNLPIGLIQAATVGTTIQTWTHYLGSSGVQYDTQVKPIQPYAIRGVNYYQGESNSSDSDYTPYMINLINEWRTDWGQGSFPFQFVQLHGSLNWAPFREQQLQAWLATSNTNMAVAIDLPPDGAMHPLTKRPIGDRLAAGARRLWYGDTTIESSGPLRDPATSYVSGNQVVIGFTHLAGGLVTGSEWQPGGAPSPFLLAGVGGKYYVGTAQIVGNTVVVTSSSVPSPVSVRYIWDEAKGNLYNTDNLPASPFELNFGSSPTATPGPTATPTRTNTPVPPTNTPTAGPSPTPTNTNTPAPPTNTPTPTNTGAPPTATNTPSGGTNLALNKVTTVSSFMSVNQDGTEAVDGNVTTYWRVQKGSSLPAEWIVVDLGSNQSISTVTLKWATYWATVYDIQVSTDNVNWTTKFSTSSGDGGTDTITFAASTARYVRMYSTNWSHAIERLRLYEIEIYQ